MILLIYCEHALEEVTTLTFDTIKYGENLLTNKQHLHWLNLCVTRTEPLKAAFQGGVHTTNTSVITISNINRARHTCMYAAERSSGRYAALHEI